MATNKKSFIMYTNWKEMFETIPDEQAGKLIKHVFQYVNDEEPETDDVLIKALFSAIKPALKDDLKRWEKQREQRSEAGKRSAEKRKDKRKSTTVNDRSNSLNEKERTSTVNVNGNVNVNVNDNVTTVKNSSINILDQKETIDHLIEKFPDLTVQEIHTELESMKDWAKAGGKRKKDWVAFARNWLKKRQGEKPPPNAKPDYQRSSLELFTENNKDSQFNLTQDDIEELERLAAQRNQLKG
jgi:hypothetical protein